MPALHPVHCAPVLPLVLVHSRIAKTHAVAKLRGPAEMGIEVTNLDLRERFDAQQINSHLLWREGLPRIGIRLQAREADMLYPSQVRRQHERVLDGCHLAARRQRLWKTERAADGAEPES